MKDRQKGVRKKSHSERSKGGKRDCSMDWKSASL